MSKKVAGPTTEMEFKQLEDRVSVLISLRSGQSSTRVARIVRFNGSLVTTLKTKEHVRMTVDTASRAGQKNMKQPKFEKMAQALLLYVEDQGWPNFALSDG